ncbi:hypothetical protein KUCAC02_034479, partial [Chaenocephalus aceratus]
TGKPDVLLQRHGSPLQGKGIERKGNSPVYQLIEAPIKCRSLVIQSEHGDCTSMWLNYVESGTLRVGPPMKRTSSDTLTSHPPPPLLEQCNGLKAELKAAVQQQVSGDESSRRKPHVSVTQAAFISPLSLFFRGESLFSIKRVWESPALSAAAGEREPEDSVQKGKGLGTALGVVNRLQNLCYTVCTRRPSLGVSSPAGEAGGVPTSAARNGTSAVTLGAGGSKPREIETASQTERNALIVLPFSEQDSQK